MGNINILWVDDEIEFLKPHIIFLEQKNYVVTTCQSGTEAINLINESDFDIVLFVVVSCFVFEAQLFTFRFPDGWLGLRGLPPVRMPLI